MTVFIVAETYRHACDKLKELWNDGIITDEAERDRAELVMIHQAEEKMQRFRRREGDIVIEGYFESLTHRDWMRRIMRSRGFNV